MADEQPPFGESPAPPPPPPPPPPPGQYGTPQPGQYGTPQPYGYGAPQTEGLAVGALVLSIVSWVICPLIPAIVALVLASQAKAKIEASGGRLTGLGLCTAARIIAWIHIGLVALFILIIVLVAIGGGFKGSTTTNYSGF
ncbi:MAG TPA: DUF4190 domain-containing protein [Acidimicrobiia bacterium]|jgi:hypothetical protein|nr:DUF4190 domain-containing protein [Acidimicrobiia bacterium]